jgi:hypothetical protein
MTLVTDAYRLIIVMPREGGASSIRRRALNIPAAAAITGSSAFADDDNKTNYRDMEE